MKKILSLIIVLAVLSLPANAQNIVSIGNFEIDAGANIRVPIYLNDSTDIAAVGINLSYNPAVVRAFSLNPEDKGSFPDFYGPDNSNNASGWITMNTYKIGEGLNGNVIIGYVRLQAVGSQGSSSTFNLNILTLSSPTVDDVFPRSVVNGTFTVIGAPVQTFNLSGYKINDTNGNEIWDSGEQGIVNWNITLKNATTGAVIASNLTNAAGFYQFLKLAQGSYNVTEEDRAGWTHTNASFRIVTLNSDIANLNFTNKLIPPPPPTFNIFGYKINDTNSNGIWDAGEQGIEGWRITLKNATSGEEIASTTTDTSGFYEFTDLAPDSYNVTEGTRAGWKATNATSQVVAIADQDIANLNFTNRPVAPPYIISYVISNRTIIPPQATSIDVEFSETVKYKIAIERGGVIYDWTGTSKNPIPRVWNGTYETNGTRVQDGIYTVNITWRNITTDLGGMNSTQTITVISENPPPAIISWSNSKTNDASLNITINEPETVSFEVTASQTINTWNWSLNDSKQNNNFNSFSHLFASAGTYTVKVNATNDNGTSNTVTWNVIVLSPSQTYNISGYKINDTNSNGVWDPGEQGIQGWNITLSNATTDVIISSTSTDVTGFYQFTNLANGSYKVAEKTRTGWNNTSAISRVITIDSGDIENLNFTNTRIFAPKPITVISPNGGEKWVAGTKQVIRWNYIGNPGANVKIQLLNNNTPKSIIAFITPIGKNGIGYYNWSIPAFQTAGTNYKVRITSTAKSAYNDTSDGDFTIKVLKPLSIMASPGMARVSIPVNITFKVTSMGKPVDNATVSLNGAGVTANATTNLTGLAVIRIHATSRGQINVLVSKDDYRNATGRIMVI